MRRPASTPPELRGYTFVKLLGSGGFSDVFLYEQQLPKRRVAVKVLITDEITDSSRAALVAEANLMAQLSSHPYIVSIYQADVASNDRPYFVMEYCSGASLADRYKRERFEVADALRTGVRLSSAVATAHAAGILHRDIKPANVLSNDFGWPALTDFGISSALEEELPLHTTTRASALAQGSTGTDGGTGQSVGLSVPWSPPEMFDDDPEPDVRSDVFSLAATIHTILAGQTPFEVRGRSNGILDLIGRIERGAITPMERDDVPRSLIAVLAKGMSSDREDRFATAVDFARALQRVELELGYAPTTIDVPNLVVTAPQRGADTDGDETRVRSVATVAAQPEAGAQSTTPTQPSAAARSEMAASAAETAVRGATSIRAQPDTERGSAEVPAETIVRRREPPPTPEIPVVAAMTSAAPRRRGVLGWIVAALAIVVVGGVAAAIIVVGVGVPDDVEPTPTRRGPAVVVDSVPTPQLAGTPAADGSTVTFSFTNPDPRDGDAFVWKITNRTGAEPVRKADGNEIVVTDFAPDSTVCIEVSVARSGKLSANPYERCYPS